MNPKIATATGLLVAACLVALWPRDGGKPLGVEEVNGFSTNNPASSVRGDGAVRPELNPRDISTHSRLVAAVNRTPSTTARPSNVEILAMLRAGQQPVFEPEDISGPSSFDSLEDPSVERDVGLWPASPEERIARLRAGDLPPMRDFVEGPPGKPRLPEGAAKKDVLEAWGPPEHVFPAHIDERKPYPDTMPPGLLPPFESDHIEYLETWVYSHPYEENQKSWHFDGDRLTARPYSIESYRAMLIEDAAQSILARKALE